MKKVISGMQTGADIAGIKAAKDCEISVGGYMPLGFKTENGRHPEYQEQYNAQETKSEDYLVRTEKNVIYSDGTVIFDYALSSGSIKTKRYCMNLKKPYLYLTKNEITNTEQCSKRILAFITENKIQTLNVAGNRESKTPGIEKRVYKILSSVFQQLKTKNL